jgi:inosose dehydratase
MLLMGAGALATRSGFTAGALPRPGCQTNAWNLDPQKFDLLLAALRDMKSLGFAGFETNIRFVQPQLNRVAEARAALERTGLVFIGAHTGLPEYVKSGATGAAEAAGKLAGEARQFGARALVVSHGGLSKTGQFVESDLERKVKALDLAGARVADTGLVLAYHNHQPEFRNNAAEETELVRHTDPRRVSFLLDIGHAWLAYPNVIPFFEEHHSRVFGLHVRDFHDGKSVPLGQGEFPLHELAVAIRRTGWSGWLIDEEERPDERDKPGMKVTGPSRKAMREIFGV